MESERSDLFEQLVVEALDGLPEQIARMMSNIEVVVEDEPLPGQLSELEPGHTLFGLYHGVPLTKRGVYDHVLPDKISIFRGPIVRYARTPDRIREQVRRTVIHEIGHHFGMEEDRLHELGWG
ncbi:MAG: metallopeptidase family protein [Actinomycetota bacterium]